MVRRLLGKLGEKSKKKSGGIGSGGSLEVLKRGHAMRVIFFYPGEEGTYVDNAEVTLFENGIIHIRSAQEETTTHLQNCEILWRFETDADDRVNKLRLLKPKGETRASTDESPDKDPGGSRKPERSPDHR